MKILIVDDEPAFRTALHRLLADEGHEIELAFNGEAALKCATLRLPDLVLLDLDLGPGLDGFDVARRLPRSVHIIVITGMPEEEIEARLVQCAHPLAGVLVRMQKPLDHEQLMDHIRRLATGQSIHPPEPLDAEPE